MSIFNAGIERNQGESFKKEDIEDAIKKELVVASQKYWNDYFESILQAGCSLEVVKQIHKIALKHIDTSILAEKLDDNFSKLYWDHFNDWDLGTYAREAIKKYGDEAILALEKSDKKVEIKKDNSRPIDYPALKDILKYQCENNSSIEKIPIVNDLYYRTYEVFKYVYDAICEDAELANLFEENNIDASVERLVMHISKYDGVVIPPPYNDIDDWWGDFNHTINYLVWNYVAERNVDRRIEEAKKESIRQEGPHKCIAKFSKIGPAEKIGGFYTKDKKAVRLNADQKKSLRWHQHYVELKDDGWGERYPGWSFGVAVLTKVGDTGEKLVMDAIKQVEQKYGSFDCYTCDKWSFSLDKYVPEKNKKMISEIRDILEKCNVEIASGSNDK